ncbi:winged helix-turn-helix transcriptional regulator [Rhodopirellula sp. P2]|uniref:winged helix-turn-helix transcriptional regulator n=1 Tax=Rhodopirellula sp. P2 TaxID=2127060 RepID=UPI0023689633|nr:helix-turn-helix domain-containing protein [Rhodopirellula sp. P2]WDQ17812.1 helix-turn-helix domain-containing protein [Rhodopirellula sp. P2]
MDTNGKSRHSNYELPACPVEATLELIGGKWKGIVLYYLMVDGRLRFSVLKRKVGCVTQRMLTKQLRELESSGLVNRIVYAEVPPRVEYELTEEGESLKPVLLALKKWGEAHALPLLEERERRKAVEAS